MSRFHDPQSRGLRRLAGRLAATVAVAALAAAGGAPSAQAFGTVWGILDQHSEHERVTRLALQCGDAVQPPECFQPVSLDNLAGKRGSFGAVGAPDDIPIHLHRDREYWHCDNSDWIDPDLHEIRGPYPQPRDRALTVLRACVEWGKDKLYNGGRNLWSFPTATPETGAVTEARSLIKSDGRVDASNPGVGLFSPTCTFNGTTSSRAKCNVLEPFGYVLHMAEDFYSHTNWADYSDPDRELSVENPAGLGREALAPFLDLRGRWFGPDDVPRNFTGSCYPKKNCRGRVIHGESKTDPGLNKDKGIIDLTTGRVSQPGTPRGRVVVGGVSNAQRAVDAAALEARRQWEVFRAELVQRYGADDAAKMTCALVLDRSQTCDQRNVLLLLDTGVPRRRIGERRGGVRVAGAAQTSAAVQPATATGERLLDLLDPTDRVAVVTFDSETGEQDVDPFTRPGGADIDDAATGDAEPDPSTEPARRDETDADPTLTPEPDPAAPGHRPRGGYTHGSEEGGEETEEHSDPVVGAAQAAGTASAVAGAAQSSAAATPVATAAQAADDESPAAAALASADALLDRRDAPRGQQGVVLVAHRLGDQGALVRRIRHLGRDGAVVSLALHGSDAIPHRVIAAVEDTGGTATATHSDAELRRFADTAATAGITHLDDALPHRKAVLHVDDAGLLGLTRPGRDLHHVERLRRRATLHVQALDAPVRVVVTDVRTLRTQRAVARRRGAARLALAPGGNYEVTIAGPAGRRYEATLR